MISSEDDSKRSGELLSRVETKQPEHNAFTKVPHQR